MSYTVKEFVEKYCSGDLQFDPGTKFAYSNSGYFLLGAIVTLLLNLSVTSRMHPFTRRAEDVEPGARSGPHSDNPCHRISRFSFLLQRNR